MNTNPLLVFNGLPKFNDIRPEHVSPAIDSLLTEGRALVEKLATATDTPDWQHFVQPIEDFSEKLSRSWGPVGHMNAVVNTPELREAYNENLAKLTDFYSDLSQDERLYNKYKAIQASAEYAQLSRAQKKIIDNEVRGFKLGGAELPPAEKVRFKEIAEQLSKLGSKFEENILDNTNDFKHIVGDAAELTGLPEDSLAAAAEAAKADGQTGYLFTLHFPSYMPVMQYCNNRALRETLYRAYATRASDQGPLHGQHDNTALMDEILKLRHEEAQLLGFAGDLANAAVAQRLQESQPDLDILVNNLGIFEPKGFFDIPDQDWQRFFDVNVLSGVRLSRLYAQGMARRGWGRVVFISSESGLQIPAEMVHYGMTKTAQLAVARGLAETLAGSGVTVNSVLPGPTRSEGVETFVSDLAREQKVSEAQVEKDFFKNMRPSSIIQRFATVEEVANMVVYVCSEQASATTGSALRVDGGVVRAIA